MEKRFSRGLIIISAFLLSISFVNIKYIYATALREEAESYRMSGYEAQERGDIDSAITWYQKAAILDPDYAAPHNDLGILFEAKGWLDKAESEYQEALGIDPNYEKAHTNAALLYERKGELEKATFHWMRRYRLGRPGDPWTNEAKQRLEKLGLLEKAEEKGFESREARGREKSAREIKAKKTKEKKTEGSTRIRSKPKKKEAQKRTEKKIRKKVRKKPVTKIKQKSPKKRKVRKKKAGEWTRIGFGSRKKPEKIAKIPKAKKSDLDRELQESLRLAEERLRKEKGKKERPRKASRKPEKISPGARSYYLKADNYYKKGEYAMALDTIRTAKKDYPGDSTLLELEQSIKNKMKEERIVDHYSDGIMRYRQKDFSGARKEFEAILNILPE